MNRLIFSVLFILICAPCGWAQEGTTEEVSLWLDPPIIESSGGAEQISVYLSNQAETLNGWSFGLTMLEGEATTVSVAFTAVSPGRALAAAGFEGGAVSFLKTSLLPGDLGPGDACGDCTAITQEVIVDTEARVFLAPTNAIRVLNFDIDVSGTPSLQYAHIVFTTETDEAAGIPATVADIGGESLAPDRRDGTEVRLFACDANYFVAAGDMEGLHGATRSTQITVDFNHAGSAVVGIQGWSYGIAHDPEMLELVDAVLDNTDTSTIKDGAAPDFDQFRFIPDSPPNATQGFTHGVVLDFRAEFLLTPANGIVDCIATYRLIGEPDCPDDALSTRIRPVGNLGTPLVRMVMVSDGNSVLPCDVKPGEVSIECATPFLRGDVNSDGRVDIADGISLFKYLYNLGPAPQMLQAADVNDDGSLDVSDGIYIINFRFLNGAPPHPPYPEIGYDPTDNGPY